MHACLERRDHITESKTKQSSMTSAPFDMMARSAVSLGKPAVLAPLFQRLTAHKSITIVAIGSSVTARAGGCTHSVVTGQRGGCCGATCSTRTAGFLRSFFEHLNRTWPHPQHKMFNAGGKAAGSNPGAPTSGALCKLSVCAHPCVSMTAGVPASTPATFVECLETWLPKGAEGSNRPAVDLFIVEFIAVKEIALLLARLRSLRSAVVVVGFYR